MTKAQQHKAAVAKAAEIRAYLADRGIKTTGRRVNKDASVEVMDGVVYVSVNVDRTIPDDVLDTLRSEGCRVSL